MSINTEYIWTTFSYQLKNFIVKRVADQYVAEDILQEVFIKIHSSMETLKDDRKIQSWVYQITRNAIIDHYRMRKPSKSLKDIIEETDELPVDDISNELTPCIQQMINSLPDIYRQALLMTEYEGLTQKEMSVRLGISISGAKSRVQRGKLLLKQMLLDCCHFEFDRLGTIIDYKPKSNPCEGGNCKEDNLI